MAQRPGRKRGTMSNFLGGVLQGNETVFLTQDEINSPYADIPTMIEDKKRKQVQMNRPLFDRITASPEVLAPYLVFFSARDNGWCSMLTMGSYDTYKEAIAATVAKLKEVCND